MTTPVLQLMHRRHPDATIDIVTSPRAAAVFEHCPYRGELILKAGHGVRAGMALVRRLRQRRYQLAVDLRTDGLAWLLRAERRMTKLGARPLGPHAVERHLGVAHGLLEDEPPTPITWTSPADDQRAANLLNDLPGSRWLALGPGARWPPKRWPAERFAALANRLCDRFDGLILLGDADDELACTQIAETVSMPVVSVAGRTSVTEAAAVLRQAAYFVGNDSALGHVAAAVGVPSLTLFGPGDPVRYHPWGRNAKWLQSPTGRLEDLSVEAVVSRIG